MTDRTRVWTKQHGDILKVLDEQGRYVVRREYIERKMEEHAALYLDVYSWYVSRAEKIVPRPSDAGYPIWVSLAAEEAVGGGGDSVMLELEIRTSDMVVLDLEKWGFVVNYMYIPQDARDEAEHEKMLAAYGIDDTKAYMTPFYPNVKSKIVKSWDRLFDDSVVMGPVKVGTLWEIRKEWIVASAS